MHALPLAHVSRHRRDIKKWSRPITRITFDAADFYRTFFTPLLADLNLSFYQSMIILRRNFAGIGDDMTFRAMRLLYATVSRIPEHASNARLRDFSLSHGAILPARHIAMPSCRRRAHCRTHFAPAPRRAIIIAELRHHHASVYRIVTDEWPRRPRSRANDILPRYLGAKSHYVEKSMMPPEAIRRGRADEVRHDFGIRLTRFRR